MQTLTQNFNESLFRSNAWVGSWIDTWGQSPSLELIDLGGRKKPNEYLYRVKSPIAGLLPVKTLALAGTPTNPMITPRAEYIDINALIQCFGCAEELRYSLKRLDWQQLIIPDMAVTAENSLHFSILVKDTNWHLYQYPKEATYQIKSTNFNDYLAQLGAATRLRFFNRRNRLSSYGSIEFKDYCSKDIGSFFKLLNQFHIHRWGTPCYSIQSQYFIERFVEALPGEDGKAILQAMMVDGEVVSIIFDVIWDNNRYNLQSGFFENRFDKVSLGSVHLGYAIEDAIRDTMTYDLLAGKGKNSNYKTHISNSTIFIQKIAIEKSPIHILRKTKNAFSRSLRQKNA
ncbi:MAG: GNAT family N-acetyltransferase [Pseudomonadales bacterium]|nr:GNAT family N-acetyltransferase [Pseudomonadales bacterium]